MPRDPTLPVKLLSRASFGTWSIVGAILIVGFTYACLSSNETAQADSNTDAWCMSQTGIRSEVQNAITNGGFYFNGHQYTITKEN